MKTVKMWSFIFALVVIVGASMAFVGCGSGSSGEVPIIVPINGGTS